MHSIDSTKSTDKYSSTLNIFTQPVNSFVQAFNNGGHRPPQLLLSLDLCTDAWENLGDLTSVRALTSRAFLGWSSVMLPPASPSRQVFVSIRSWCTRIE